MDPTLPKPTPAETEILNALWDLGPSTVRQVHDVLDARHKTGYTTVLKLMQIMTDKGLVRREDGDGRAHIYTPTLERDLAQRQMVRDLVDRIFGGSATQLVLQALEERPASEEELDEIRQMIGKREKGASA
ncbi:MAG: BlaI/MecI/CopY family transcriptional regulator [Bryobacteraceae bacterium]|nr:BlaI/MecI/CopY family transcriptional regulator [Bryobacteraceae bacterium]